MKKDSKNTETKQCTIPSVMPSADLKFILTHKQNGTEIENRGGSFKDC